MADRTIVEWTGTFKMDEGLGFFSYVDIVDHEGNIYSGTLTFDQAYSIPGFDIEGCTGVTELNFPNLVSIDPNNTQGGTIFIKDNSALTSVDFPLLVSQGPVGLVIQNCSSLVTINLPNWIPNNLKTIRLDGNALSDISVNQILARCVANAAYVDGPIFLSGGTNSAPTGQGIADKATLIGRGVSVTTN